MNDHLKALLESRLDHQINEVARDQVPEVEGSLIVCVCVNQLLDYQAKPV